MRTSPMMMGRIRLMSSKVLIAISVTGIAVYFIGRSEGSVITQVLGFVLVAVMFGIFTMRKRQSR